MARKGIKVNAPGSIALGEGTAMFMGDGMFVIDQEDHDLTGNARFQRVAIHIEDMRRMVAAVAGA